MATSKQIVPLSFFAHMVNDGAELVLPTLLPLMARDFNLSYSQIGVLGGSMVVAIGFGQMLMGYLSDLTGRRRVFVSLGLVLLSLGMFGISRSISYEQLILFNLIAGVGASVYHPVGISAISQMFKNDRKGRALGIHGAGGNIGQCVFPLAAGILADFVGWRIVFAAFPILGLVVSVLFFAVLREPKVKVEKLRLRSILNSRLLIIALSLGFISMAARGMIVFFPVRLSSIGYSSSYVGFLFSLLFGAGIFGQYAGGYFSDTYSKKKMIAYLCLISSALLFIPFFTSGLCSIAAIMLMAGFARDAVWPPFFSLTTEKASEKFYGTTLGVFFSIGYVMSSQASVMMGVLWDHSSFIVSMSLLLVFGVAAALLIRKT
jgi:FSR family fosmidomycin resistance protein-like MFS transporter